MAVQGGFDFRELTGYTKKMLDVAKRDFPRETKNFMGRSAYRLEKNIRNAYKEKTKQKTGNLLAGIERGRAYIYGTDEYSARVKNTAPHAHLIERGHVYYNHGKPTNKYVKGKNIVGQETKIFENGEFVDMTDQFIDKLIDAGKI